MASMAMSVLVLGAIVLAIYGVGQLLYGYPADERDLEYEQVLDDARANTEGLGILAPPHRPEGWRANHADFVPGNQWQWRLGLLTEEGRYIGLNQVHGTIEAALEDYAEGSDPAGTARLAGEEWQVFERPADRETTYARADGESRVVLVTGTAPREVIEAYIESLTTD